MTSLFRIVGAAALGIATTATQASEPLVLRPLQADSLAAALEAEPIDPEIKLASLDDVGESYGGYNVGSLYYTPYRPVWGVRAGAAILNRDASDDITIATVLGGLLEISTGSDFDFGYTGGADIAVERRLGNSCNSIEVRYLGALDWNSQVGYDVLGDVGLGPNPILGVDFIDARYRSSLDSIEINFRHQTSDRFTWLAGFRYVNLDEQLNYAVNFIVPNLVDLNWDANNDLYGAQIGGDFQLWRLTGPLRVNSVMKAGIYGNSADNDFAFNILNIPVLAGGDSGSQTAFVGEINFNAAYQITSHVALRGGYQLLWIDGVALATHQAAETLAQGGIDIVDTSAAVFYHGALVGVDFVW